MTSTGARSLMHGSTAAMLLLAGCGSNADLDGAPVGPSASSAGSGTIRVRLEPLDGVLVEGFQLAVRLEAPPGHALVSSTWAELVREQSPTPSLPEIYDFVVRTPAPAGPFVLNTIMHPGMEDPQSPCVTRGNLADGGTVTVVVKFQNIDGCSRLS